MKKTVFAILMSALLTLAACSAPKESDTNTNSPDAGNSEQSTTVPSAETPKPAQNGDTEAHEIVYSTAEAYKNSIGTVWVQAVVQIKNTGSVPLYLDASSMDIENAEGKLIKTLGMCSVYPQVIAAGETALIVEQTTLDSDPGDGELKVIAHYEAKKAKVDCIRLTVSEEELTEDQFFGLKMKGRVENNTTEAQKLVYVVANLYDANDRAIGQLTTILTNELKSGEKVGFELSTLSAPDSLTKDSVARFEVFAFPFQYQF